MKSFNAQNFNFNEVQVIFSFVTCAFDIISKKPFSDYLNQQFIQTWQDCNFSNKLNLPAIPIYGFPEPLRAQSAAKDGFECDSTQILKTLLDTFTTFFFFF